MAIRRKLGRTRDPRRALMRGLATDLIDHQAITTTKAKAKTLIPYVERLITKAKKGDLHNRRQIIALVSTPSSAHKLVDNLAGRLGGRNSGHLRLRPAGWRKGDHSPLATVSFVDLELTSATPTPAGSLANAKAKAIAGGAKQRPARRQVRPVADQTPQSQPGTGRRQSSGRNRANQKRV